MPLDLIKLVPVYQSAIDDIINKMGKKITIHFPNMIENVNVVFDDPVRPGETRMPDYKGVNANPSPTVTQNTKSILALHKYAPKEWRLVAPNTNEPNNILRLKTFLIDVPDLVRCEYIIPSSDSQNYIVTKYRLIKEPVPAGLQQDRYAVSYWQRS